MGKPTICIGENKGADQLRSNCEADQHHCFLLHGLYNFSSTYIKSFKLLTSSVTVQPGLCGTW